LPVEIAVIGDGAIISIVDTVIYCEDVFDIELVASMYTSYTVAVDKFVIRMGETTEAELTIVDVP
jgi:hypothetical protein